MAPDDPISPEKLARLKSRYEARDETIAAIAADEGLTRQAIAALRCEHGWRLRNPPRSPAKKARAVKKHRKSKIKSKVRTDNRTSSPAARKTAKSAAKKTSEKPAPPPPGAVDMPTLIARIRAQLEGALAAAQARTPEADPDETARLMASLTRTLQSLRALEKDTPSDERTGDGTEAPPLDLAELRRELARRIDLLRQDREGA